MHPQQTFPVTFMWQPNSLTAPSAAAVSSGNSLNSIERDIERDLFPILFSRQNPGPLPGGHVQIGHLRPGISDDLPQNVRRGCDTHGAYEA